MQLSDFKAAIGISRADVENWLPKLDLSTEYAPTVPGVPREFTRENVLELGIIAAMRKTGCSSLLTAAAYARMVIRGYRNGDLREWVAFPAGDFTKGTGTNSPADLDFAALAEASPNRAVSLIHLGKIVATVENLFAETGDH